MGFVDIATQVPALAVLAFVVVVFVKYLAKREESLAQFRHEELEVIRENSKVLGEVHSTLKRLNGHTKE